MTTQRSCRSSVRALRRTSDELNCSSIAMPAGADSVTTLPPLGSGKAWAKLPFHSSHNELIDCSPIVPNSSRRPEDNRNP